MPLTTGPQPYRSNLLNEIKNRLGTFVPSGSTSVGAVLLKELLQNADDAGASEVTVILNHRDSTAKRLRDNDAAHS